jgi:hypothetical protein
MTSREGKRMKLNTGDPPPARALLRIQQRSRDNPPTLTPIFALRFGDTGLLLAHTCYRPAVPQNGLVVGKWWQTNPQFAQLWGQG